MVWHKGKTTFKEVCDDLAYELVGENEGESKNIRRRVYDALNVLIATGVICKQGKTIFCVTNKVEEVKKDLTNYRQSLRAKRDQITAKRERLREVSEKLVSLKGLIKRNEEQNIKDSECVEFPYILLATPDNPKNSMSIKLNSNNSKIWSSFAQPVNIVGDIDTLRKFRLTRDFSLLPEQVRNLTDK